MGDDVSYVVARVLAIKTSVYLDEADKRRLAELARATGASEADLIRRGVSLVPAQAQRPRPRLGIGASTDGRRTADTDRLLDEYGFGE